MKDRARPGPEGAQEGVEMTTMFEALKRAGLVTDEDKARAEARAIAEHEARKARKQLRKDQEAATLKALAAEATLKEVEGKFAQLNALTDMRQETLEYWESVLRTHRRNYEEAVQLRDDLLATSLDTEKKEG